MLPREVESLVLRILDGPEAEWDTALGRLAAQHPDVAPAIHAHVELLKPAFVGTDAANTERANGDGAASIAAGSEDGRPTWIGPYRILGVLGEGGMGTVFMAEQRQPVRRRVALKLIKLGMDSKSVVARFEQERQALALMDHDGIARVFDGGTSERGQPYFVMELVKGMPLTDYCDHRRMPLPARLQLMRKVCAAVQHAHQKGLVHRDLKPSNVLVADGDDGTAQPKILDFGLAKAIGGDLVGVTLYSELGQVIGTPEYMAPEQAMGRDVDTRTDVYALGVMLYELLVGELPFPTEQLRKGGFGDMQRILSQVEPPRPSSRLGSGEAHSGEIARRRRVSISELRRALRTDLDWLVFKALEKDRNRRYETVAALSADLQRYLDHEPLVAGPPSARYRLRKLVRRHRVVLATASAVFIALLAGGIGTFMQYLRAEQQAEANGKLAGEKSQLAAQVELKATALADTVGKFEELSGVVEYERAIRDEQALYPAWPDRVPAMTAWLAAADRLLRKEPQLRATIAELQQQALPMTPAEVEAALQEHPRFAEYDTLRNRVNAMRLAQDVRRGRQAWVEPVLPVELRSKTPAEWNEIAWAAVDWHKPDRPRGQERLALACARAAVDRAPTDADRANFGDTLAWALFFCGRDEAALAQAQRNVELAGESKAEYEGHLAAMRAHVAAEQGDAGESAVALAERELAALRAELRPWRFANSGGAEAADFLHRTLAELLGKFETLRSTKANVVLRRDWANRIVELTMHHPNCRHAWADVRASIAANPRYAAREIPLLDEDVARTWLGLVPLGENPATHYWEFYDLRSAWDGDGDPAAIDVPRHRDDGSIDVTDGTGIVYVLLPGGTVLLGSQADDERAPLYDPQRQNDEALHEVTLTPFLMARHELTQGQWARLCTWDPRLRDPSYYKAGQRFTGVVQRITLANPVEQVDWTMCDTLLTRHGMVLPTEAQWEYGCRAGSVTPWIVDLGELRNVANLADEDYRAVGTGQGGCETWHDGHVVHAPVGSFAANAFGLHDMHGNVYEWCRDWYWEYGRERPTYGLGTQMCSADRVLRGGCHNGLASAARSANRDHNGPSLAFNALGLRAARLVAR